MALFLVNMPTDRPFPRTVLKLLKVSKTFRHSLHYWGSGSVVSCEVGRSRRDGPTMSTG